MSTERTTKINQLLSKQPQGIVFQSSWLVKHGYTPELQKRYRKSRWLESIGSGAMIRTGDRVTYEGAIYALQKQTSSTIHPGGKTALSLLGRAHYLDLSPKKVFLFGGQSETLPGWFKKHEWGVSIVYRATAFLPPDTGLSDFDVAQKSFSIKVSTAARALMECLYLAPEKQDLTECFQLMENLNNLRPDTVQALLEACRSIKVKRLFLYMAERAKHDWFTHLDTGKVDLGRGKRHIASHGVYIPKYHITVPRELAPDDSASL